MNTGSTMGSGRYLTQGASPRFSVGDWRGFQTLKSRSTGPGGLHNIGNLLALFGSISVHCIAVSQHQSVATAMTDYLFGASGSACLTLSMIIFVANGELYHRACQPGKPVNQFLLRLGDLLGGIAALIATIALMSFGNATCALIAGSLLTLAKIGSFAFPPTSETNRNMVLNAVTFRYVAMASRIPSLGAVGLTFLVGFSEGEVTSRTAVAAIMFLCYLLWLWGDCCLLKLQESK